MCSGGDRDRKRDFDNGVGGTVILVNKAYGDTGSEGVIVTLCARSPEIGALG